MTEQLSFLQPSTTTHLQPLPANSAAEKAAPAPQPAADAPPAIRRQASKSEDKKQNETAAATELEPATATATATEKQTEEESNESAASPAPDVTARQALLKHPNLWRAGELQSQYQAGLASGHPALDEHLPGGGWPRSGLMELLLPSAGVGELRLLLPALSALSHSEQRWVAWVNPPFVPYAPALQAAGVDTSKILLIHPRRHDEALWALERACRSGTCSAALAWLDEKKLKLKDTQRLQVAAKQGGTLTCLLRPQQAQQQASMAELRLALQAGAPGTVQLDIVKRRGGWPLQTLMLELPGTLAPHQLQQQIALWRAFRQQRRAQTQSAAVTPTPRVDAYASAPAPLH